MRNGNNISLITLKSSPSKFLSYLWGMETRRRAWYASWRFLFLSYLWGMETTHKYRIYYQFHFRSYPTYEEWKRLSFFIKCQKSLQFLSYLWGMETRSVETFREKRICVLILPMRNGNKEIVVRNNLRNKNSSYLTYEEWKQYFYFFLFYRIYFVLILPMRNGNYDPLSNTTGNLWQFLSYLWGIKNKETRV